MIEINPSTVRKMLEVIFAVELSSDVSKINRLTRAAGGRSGWSFGKCQHDYPNNPKAERILRDCGISIDSLSAIQGVYDNDHPLILKLNKQLADRRSAMIIEAADQTHIQEAIEHFNALGLNLDSDLKLAIAMEYHTQFYISKGGKFHEWAKSLEANTSDNDFLIGYDSFKAELPWWNKEIREGFFGHNDHHRRLERVISTLEDLGSVTCVKLGNV